MVDTVSDKDRFTVGTRGRHNNSRQLTGTTGGFKFSCNKSEQMAATRKMNGGARKTRKMAGGKRKLSPALKAWNKKVMEMYRTMKKKNPNTKLKDAMRAAKKAK